ncbi:MAG: T9SS type A sorting domain-containing protein [Bacteroidetes bacterium]|nr:T9SS type A sorting domain-containing protein [Bacteroidota bacterium]
MRTRTKLSVRKVVVVAAATCLLVTAGLFVFFNLSNSQNTFAASSGDFRSAASGNWSTIATWQKYNGTAWVAATAAPTIAGGIVTIQSGHIVTVSANASIDQLVISSGGELDLASGKTLTIANGAGTDFDVSGIFKNSGTVTINANANIIFENGGKYQHNFTTTAGAIPVATWSTGSTCEIVGYTTCATAPTGLQSFYNFTWNCPSQTANINLGGGVTSMNGDLTISNTGTKEVYLGTGTATLAVAGNLSVTGGTLSLTSSTNASGSITISGNYNLSGGSLLVVEGNNSTGTVTVSGNYSQTGGTIALAGSTNAVGTLNVAGNYSLSAGSFVSASGNNATGTINLSGNYAHTGGTISVTGNINTTAQFNFSKTGIQTFVASGNTVTGSMNYTVNSGTILDLGTNILLGNNFTLNSGGGILIGSPNGISENGTTGNIQVTGSISLSSGGNYTYNGTAAQVTGNGLPENVHNLTINNASGVTFSSNEEINISGVLALTSGKLIAGSQAIQVSNTSPSAITGYSATNYIVGNLRRNVNGTGSYDFPIGTSSSSELLNVTLSSATGFTNILASFVNTNPLSGPLTGVAVNGTTVDNMLDYGYWTLAANTAMTGGTYAVTANENGQSNSGPSPQSYTILVRQNATSAWQSVGTHSNGTQGVNSGVVTAKRSAFSNFNNSHIGIGYSAAGSLPIELIYFKSKLEENKVDLTWATASELNNDYFTIERSSDGTHFDPLLRKPGAGNSTVALYYSDVDENPLQGYSYYRLKQTDYNGHFTYSEITTVKNNTKEDDAELKITSVTPNPFHESFTVSFILKTSAAVDFQLINSSGQTIKKETITANDGMNQYEFIDFQNLQSGIYYVILFYQDKKFLQKIVKN